MALTEQVLHARARRAYELGRLRGSMRIFPVVLGAAVAAIACGRPLPLSCALCGALFALAVGFGFAGGAAGRAVLPGLAGGSAALAMPLLTRTLGVACGSDLCMSLCLPACVLGGAIAGAIIGAKARSEQGAAGFVLPALLLAGLTGALGCSLAGTAGVFGMLAGTLAAGAPLVLARRDRAG